MLVYFWGEQTALHLAALTSQNRVVRQLVVSGATVDVRNQSGNTALHIACESGDLEVVKSILKPISPCEVVDAQLEHYKPQIQGCNLMDMVHEMNYAGEDGSGGQLELMRREKPPLHNPAAGLLTQIRALSDVSIVAF